MARSASVRRSPTRKVRDISCWFSTDSLEVVVKVVVAERVNVMVVAMTPHLSSACFLLAATWPDTLPSTCLVTSGGVVVVSWRWWLLC